MKKLLAIIIAAVMIAACTVTAFADTTDVSYDVQPTYTVAIPASVTLGDADVTADITASDVLLGDNQQIEVELTSASNTPSGSTFNAKNGDSNVTYTITGDSAIAVGDTVATFTADGSKTLTFSAADKSAVTVAGAHTETLTFTVKVDSGIKSFTITHWSGDLVVEYSDGDTWRDMIAKYPEKLSLSSNGYIVCYANAYLRYRNNNGGSGTVSPDQLVDLNVPYYVG